MKSYLNGGRFRTGPTVLFWIEPSALRQRRLASKLGLFEIACDCYLFSAQANCERTNADRVCCLHYRLLPAPAHLGVRIPFRPCATFFLPELPGSFTSVSLLGATVQAGSSRRQLTPAFTIRPRHLGLSSSTIFFCTLKSSSARIFEIASHRIQKVCSTCHTCLLFTL